MREFRVTYAALALVGVMSLGGAALSDPAQAVSVSSGVDRMTVDIGDVVTLSVTLQYDNTISVALPQPDKNFGEFEIHTIEIGDPEPLSGDRISLSAEYRLWALEIGERVLPTLEIPYQVAGDSLPRFVYTPSVSIVVHSVVGELVDSAEIKPLRDPLEDPLGVSPLYEESRAYWYGLAAFALALGAALWWVWSRKRAEEALEDRRPAWEKALERLANLSANNYLGNELYKEYYSELTATFKEYLGRLFAFPALDMTTRELLAACDADTITQSATGELEEILGRADMIKFAKALPPQEIPEKDFQRVYEMVQVIKEEYQVRERAEALRREEAKQAGKTGGGAQSMESVSSQNVNAGGPGNV